MNSGMFVEVVLCLQACAGAELSSVYFCQVRTGIAFAAGVPVWRLLARAWAWQVYSRGEWATC
jgi:hypothetical protein